MPVTKNDYLDALAGRASDVVIDAVLAEVRKHDSELSKWINREFAWRYERLISVSPLDERSPAQLPEDMPLSGNTVKSRRVKVRQQRPQILEDFFLFCRGEASPAAIERLRFAMSDPGSQLWVEFERRTKPEEEQIDLSYPEREALTALEDPNPCDSSDREDA